MPINFAYKILNRTNIINGETFLKEPQLVCFFMMVMQAYGYKFNTLSFGEINLQTHAYECGFPPFKVPNSNVLELFKKYTGKNWVIKFRKYDKEINIEDKLLKGENELTAFDLKEIYHSFAEKEIFFSEDVSGIMYEMRNMHWFNLEKLFYEAVGVNVTLPANKKTLSKAEKKCVAESYTKHKAVTFPHKIKPIVKTAVISNKIVNYKN